MVSSAHVLSASRPDFRDIITRQASGVPGIKTVGFLELGKKLAMKPCPEDKREPNQSRWL